MVTHFINVARSGPVDIGFFIGGLDVRGGDVTVKDPAGFTQGKLSDDGYIYTKKGERKL